MWFETGKFSATDWEASWITDGYDKDYEPSPMFRKVFDVSKEVASARCYISGLGYYRLSFNGKAVNDHANPIGRLPTGHIGSVHFPHQTRALHIKS